MLRRTKAGIIFLLMFVGFSASATAEVSFNRRDVFLSNFEAGEAAFGKKQFPEAIRYFQNALNIQPDQVRPRYRMGQALAALGRNSESVTQFSNLLEKHPDHITARVCLAQGLIKIGRMEDARRQLVWILRVQPEHAKARELLAKCLPDTAVVPAISGFSPIPRVEKAQKGPVTGNLDESPEKIPDGFQPLSMRPGVVVEDETAGVQSKPIPEKLRNHAQEALRPVPPIARKSDTWRVADFLTQTKESFGVTLEYAKFNIEKGDLEKAAKNLDLAEELAVKKRDTRQFLETQIHRSLLNLYKSDIREFGQQLLKIKPLLSRETYNSFLDIYNRAQNASSPSDVARLVGGVALGAEHFAVASAVFAGILEKAPGDLFAARLLAEAQMGQRNYAGAEQTFINIARTHPESAEGAMNLAKFYLTAKFDPAAATRYLGIVARIDPTDHRVPVMGALIACVGGRSKEGVAGMRKGLAEVNDPQIKLLAHRILEEMDAARQTGRQIDYSSLLALPGSRGNSTDDLKMIGEDYLKQGSYFAALKNFHEAHDLAEIGRCYLALASQLFSNGDEETSALSAGFGLQALNEELRKNPASSRADLYLALYHFERRAKKQAKSLVEAGLRGQAEPATRRHLRLLYEKLKG